MAIVVGLTGKCCVGKDTAAAFFSAQGWQVIDVDKTGHRALQEEQAALEAAFGTEIFHDNGQVNRRALGEIVFSDSGKLKTLEALVHPRMRKIVQQSAAFYTGNGVNVCINAALLFPMDLHGLCRYVLVIKAPFLLRIKRARRRSGWSYSQILKRFWSQRRLFPKKKTQNVDMYNVWNSKSREVLQQKLAEFLTKIERQG
jgi:dephospho-CoA kinase